MLEQIKEAARGYKDGSGRSLWRDLAWLIFGVVILFSLAEKVMR